ncbi:S-layer family protein [Pleurocapsa sp. PCC 7319]|uniref:two-partner secretion domain-containing protein n=1 Tax=Pleurocapsa sp. PCC 7319 TaxID=118161 RepID=UPI000349324B|nr:S-layer family protein [Pleurocapsa sp. PCC 7319]
MKKRLSLLLFLVGCIIIPGILVKSATAQVTPDGTTSTTVDANGNNLTIQNGDRAGNNLFHSFQDFSVPTDGEAFFDNATDIANILSRVTGGNISNIDGLIRANGSANLFLINPAGIIFGENASLNVGGSFYGSSASSILFEDGEFSAVDNIEQPILTINAPIGLGFRDEPGEIVNRSRVENSSGLLTGLEISSGNNLAFVGGDIRFESGNATARGGNIYLGGLAEAGIVNLNQDGSLSFPDDLNQANITLTNAADVDVQGAGGGNITIDANNLSLAAGELGISMIRGGISSNSTNPQAQAGDITINVAENISLDDSNIRNRVEPEGIGNAGNITITTDSLELIDGGSFSASTFGQGNGGAVNVTATGNITATGEGSDGISSGIFSAVATDATGNSGGITISTTNLNLTAGSVVNASTFGQGNAGDITIDTGTLTLSNGGEINSDTSGQGNAGLINIIASDTIIIDGVDSEGDDSDVTSEVNSEGVGDAGDITIDTGTLILSNGGEIETDTSGEGNAGDIIIDTGTLTLSNGGELNSDTSGQGNAGSINITARDTITIDGVDSGGDDSDVTSEVNSEGVGDAGDITIDTGTLILSNGGGIETDTSGEGNAGSINITATGDLTIDGEDSEGIPSGATSLVDTGGVGDAGGVTISTTNLNLTNGGRVSASTFGQGDAGNVTIDATESIFISGAIEGSRSGISANALINNGNGGNVNVFTEQLTIANGGTIEASNFDNIGERTPGTGEPGNILIEANNLDLVDTARIEAATQAEIGNSANINLQVDDTITLEDSSFISAQAFNNANGGNLTIDTNFLVAFPDGNNDIIANAQQGNGGNINITAESLFGIAERPLNPNTNDINASSEFGLDGSISIFTPDINAIQTDLVLPNNLVESEETVAQACQNDRISGKSSGLTIQGKGGIPPQPTEPIDSEAILVQGKITTSKPPVQAPDIPPLGSNMGNILPARGIIKTEDGQIILTAYSTDQLDTRTPHISPNCR